MLSSFSSVAVGSLRSNTPCNNLLEKLFYVKWLHLREREWTDNYILLLLKLATAVKATKMMVVEEEFMQLAYF